MSATYSAFWQKNHSKIIFRHKPAEKVRELLPKAARVCPDPRSTIGRVDGGDEFEWALFEVEGQKIVVQRD